MASREKPVSPRYGTLASDAFPRLCQGGTTRALRKRASYCRPSGKGFGRHNSDVLHWAEGAGIMVPPGSQLVDRRTLPAQGGAREDISEPARQRRAGAARQTRQPVVHPLRAHQFPPGRGDQQNRARVCGYSCRV